MIEILLILFAAILSFFIVVFSIPPIMRVARAKNLFDKPGDRKIHEKIVPALGGVAIFLGFILSSIIATHGYRFVPLKYLIASLILVFFIGLKDDLLSISPKKKFFVQFLAAIMLVTLGNVRFTNLHGIFGVYELHYIAGIFLSLLAILTIINAFNLIDGIDGLASGTGILATLILGLWFFETGHVKYAIIAFALVGSLAGFFIFNVFGKENKLFMGDAGSLIIGMIVSALIIQFNEFNTTQSMAYAIEASPSVSFAIISFPLMDMLRVMTLRISRKQSPFRADKNHIHHRLLELLHGHLPVTLVILTVNLIVVALAFFLNYLSLNVNIQFLLILLTCIGLSFVPSKILRVKKSRLIPISPVKSETDEGKKKITEKKEEWVPEEAIS